MGQLFIRKYPGMATVTSDIIQNGYFILLILKKYLFF